MIIAKFRKHYEDRKRYVVDYTNWMDKDENLSGVTMEGNNPEDAFYVDGYVVDDTLKCVVFYVVGGVPGGVYNVSIQIETSKQQVKNDTIQMVVM